MTRTTTSARRATAALCLFAAACGSDRATAPRSRPFDLSAVLAAAAMPGTYSAGVAVGPGFGFATAGVLGVGRSGDCAWSDAAQAFACAPVTASGITATTAYTPLDAAGQPQRDPSAATTAAVRVVSTMTGTLTGGVADTAGLGAMRLDVRSETTVSGLLAGPRVVNGTSTFASSFGDGTRGERTTRMTQTTSGLVLPNQAGGYPAAGTITSELSGSFAGAAPSGSPLVASSRIVMTFDGTSRVRVDITTGGVTRRCTLDLAAVGAGGSSTSGFRCDGA